MDDHCLKGRFARLAWLIWIVFLVVAESEILLIPAADLVIIFDTAISGGVCEFAHN